MKKISLIVSSVLTLIVFSFSFATGEQSGSLSLEISNFILNIITDVFPNNSILIADLHIVIRKSAHMFEYFVLGISWFITGKLWNLSYFRILIIGMIVAFSDEAIQIYAENRGPSVFDAILYDFVPYTISSLLLFLINNRRGKTEMTSNTLARLQTNEISTEAAYKELYKKKRRKMQLTRKAHFIKLKINVPEDKTANRILKVLFFFPFPIFIVRFILMFVKEEKYKDNISLDKAEILKLITSKGINIDVNTKSGEKIVVKTI
ncbi:MAG: VanZ family protein [Tenericutes bacterium]|nr:VanZ family protein [Mycoplasmatota bacterium]